MTPDVSRELAARYDAALKTLPAGDAALAAARAAEDEYRRLCDNLIRENGGSPEVVRAYSHPFAFGGGAAAADTALADICASVRRAALRAGVEAPALEARWWPESAPTAQSAIGAGGILVRVNTGLLAQLRLLLHLVCPLLPRILSGEEVSLEVGCEFRRMLDEAVGGEPLPLWWTVRVQRSDTENVRRKAMMGAIAYVLAHELCHHVGRGAEFTRAARGNAGEPRPPGLRYSEQHAVAAIRSEMEADIAATTVLLAWASGFRIEPLEIFVGAAAVLVMQATLFWLSAARREPLAWTHPVPDLRIAGVKNGLLNPELLARVASSNPDPADIPVAAEDARARRLTDWLYAMSGVGAFRSAALAGGIEDIGLTPLQRAAIYFAYGLPQTEKPDER